jgi:hypothetical protein
MRPSHPNALRFHTPIIERPRGAVVEDYLAFGILKHGFARARRGS